MEKPNGSFVPTDWTKAPAPQRPNEIERLITRVRRRQQVKWLGFSLGSASGAEMAPGAIIQFPDYEPNDLVRPLLGDDFCKKIKDAKRLSGEFWVGLLCNHKTGKIEVWIQRNGRLVAKAPLYLRDIVEG